MNFVVEFQLPRGLPNERIRQIGESSLGLWMVVGLDKQPKAIVNDFFVKPGSVVFQLEILDENLADLITTGEPDCNYTWINPIVGMTDEPH